MESERGRTPPSPPRAFPRRVGPRLSPWALRAVAMPARPSKLLRWVLLGKMRSRASARVRKKSDEDEGWRKETLPRWIGGVTASRESGRLPRKRGEREEAISADRTQSAGAWAGTTARRVTGRIGGETTGKRRSGVGGARTALKAGTREITERETCEAGSTATILTGVEAKRKSGGKDETGSEDGCLTPKEKQETAGTSPSGREPLQVPASGCLSPDSGLPSLPRHSSPERKGDAESVNFCPVQNAPLVGLRGGAVEERRRERGTGAGRGASEEKRKEREIARVTKNVPSVHGEGRERAGKKAEGCASRGARVPPNRKRPVVPPPRRVLAAREDWGSRKREEQEGRRGECQQL